MQTILIVEDDLAVRDGIAALLERAGRELILCSDIESAQLVAEKNALACVITDMRLSSPFRYEGLDFIAAIKRSMGDGPIIGMTGARAEGLEREALARGATVVLEKPFKIEELEAYLPPLADSDGVSSIVCVPGIDEVISSPLLVPVFQPILDVGAADTVHGYESLARFNGPLFSSPEMLFRYAAQKGRLVDLELACIRRTLDHAALLPADARIFINVHPEVFATERLAAALDTAVAQAGIAPERIVIEITEQGSLGASASVARQCAELRRRGFSFALDDVGMAYSHLAHIEQIRPVYLKVSQEFGTDFETNPTRMKIVSNVLSLARDFDCDLILEGIESAETRDAARALGVRLCQGYFFGRPSPASHCAALAQRDLECGGWRNRLNSPGTRVETPREGESSCPAG